ncbi:MAG: tetratricopeptide repeat protein [Polaromonas sp.]|uniref:tetratricopeptide repeat protein n=1 Tax=Polaromonas sp. TaxID=1869339 RepID=UPI0027337D44|nr:tetratricopeptide repeat protein [Polaromonas sp.]MDP2819895.1 tetratricopeptide repeat protein [Polaromonas sp.]
MKLYSLLAALSAALTLSATPVRAQEAAWQTSYQLEAAGKYTEAIAAIDSVPANGPDAELKLLRRGWLYYLPGKFDDSIREYRLAIDRNGKSLDARLGITLPLLAAKRWREAEQSARFALEMAPNNYFALVRLAVAQEAQRDWVGMEKTAATLVTSYTTDASAYVYLARASAWLDKKDESVAAYTAVLSRFPGHLEAKAYLVKK